MRKPVRNLAFAALSAAVLLTAAGCSRPARSEPLEVTYYYLPG